MTKPADKQDQRPLLLTPGPLTTSEATRHAMLRDWGSRDSDFIALTARVRCQLEAICNSQPTHRCIPIQGSGTFAVEAMIGTMVPPNGRLVVASNGAYGRRIATIANRLGRKVNLIESREDRPTDIAQLDQALSTHSPSHLAIVHCETTSGVLNPIGQLADMAHQRGIATLVDAMSSFGALPLDCQTLHCDAVAASANKCLEGVPGVAFVIARTAALGKTAGNAPSLSLDLHEQAHGLDSNGQWRFTPPTHVMAALSAALDQFVAEGGQPARLARYQDNCDHLVSGMRALGFETFLRDTDQAPIIITFKMPAPPEFAFDRFYAALHDKGVVIYPGKITDADTFRVGCIGAITRADIEFAQKAVQSVLNILGLRSGAPA